MCVRAWGCGRHLKKCHFRDSVLNTESRVNTYVVSYKFDNFDKVIMPKRHKERVTVQGK